MHNRALMYGLTTLTALLTVAFWVIYFVYTAKLVKQDKCKDTKNLGYWMIGLSLFAIGSVSLVEPIVSGLAILACMGLYFYATSMFLKERKCHDTKKQGTLMLIVGVVYVVIASITFGVIPKNPDSNSIQAAIARARSMSPSARFYSR